MPSYSTSQLVQRSVKVDIENARNNIAVEKPHDNQQDRISCRSFPAEATILLTSDNIVLPLSKTFKKMTVNRPNAKT